MKLLKILFVLFLLFSVSGWNYAQEKADTLVRNDVRIIVPLDNPELKLVRTYSDYEHFMGYQYLDISDSRELGCQISVIIEFGTMARFWFEDYQTIEKTMQDDGRIIKQYLKDGCLYYIIDIGPSTRIAITGIPEDNPSKASSLIDRIHKL